MTTDLPRTGPARVPTSMFIGWAPAPAVDRRFLAMAIPALIAGVGGAAYGVAAGLGDPGAGAWRTGEMFEVDGVVAFSPYPMLRVHDDLSPFGMRSVLIVAEGKCTRGLKLASASGLEATARGVLIERGRRMMLEVPLTLGDWLSTRPASAAAQLRLDPPVERLGRVALNGQIMDSKCFFGVMRPSRGRTHKACAQLCIRGGIPASFWTRDRAGREAVLLMTNEAGGPIGDAILPLVAEQAAVTGELVRVGDLLQLRADPDAYRAI